MTAQIELGKRWCQQHDTPVTGNKVGKQRRLGIAQIRAGIGGIDSNRHGPPLKPFAIINASILPAQADTLPPQFHLLVQSNLNPTHQPIAGI